MSLSQTIRHDMGKHTTDDVSFIGPGELSATKGCRYSPDSPVLRRAYGRGKVNTAAPGSGTSSIVCVDFNSVSDQILMYQGTSVYRMTATSSGGTFIAVNDQKETSAAADVAVTLSNAPTIPIVHTKVGELHIIADGANQPRMLEDNFRMRELGLEKPKWAATFVNPATGTTASGGTASVAIAPNTATSSRGVVENLANSYDTVTGNESTYATLRSTATIVAGATWTWTSTATTATSWEIGFDASGSSARVNPNGEPQYEEEPQFSYTLKLSTDGGTTFSDVATSQAIHSRIEDVVPVGTSTSPTNIVLQVELRNTVDTAIRGSAVLNVFQIGLWRSGERGTATSSYSTTNSGIRYAFSEVRKYTRTLAELSNPFTVEVESSLTPLSPDVDADPLTFTKWYGVRITRGALENTDATHWRIYRSTDGATNDDTKAVDVFSAIATVDKDISIFVDKLDEVGHPLDWVDLSQNAPILVIGDILYDANSPPPTADVIGSFRNSVLYATSNKPGVFWWSRPQQPDYVPSAYGVLMDGKVNGFDDIGVLVVYTTQSLHGFPTLPLAGDPAFAPDRMKKPISRVKGLASRRGVAQYQPNAQPLLSAFVASDGLYATNGAQVWLISHMLDWPNEINTDDLSNAILLNDPKERCLRLITDDTSGVKQEWAFFYNRPSGGFAVCGPRRWPDGSADTLKQVSGKDWLFSETGGIVYEENTGTTDAANLEDSSGSITMNAITGQVYPFGVGRTGKIERVRVHTPQAVGESIKVTVYTRVDGKQDVTSSKTISCDMPGFKDVNIVPVGRLCESFRIEYSNATSGFPGINGYSIDTAPGAEISAGRQA